MLDEFFAYLERQEGVPPLTRSWSALVRMLRDMPSEDLLETLREVESTFVIRTDGEDYERWSEAKRWKANEAAAFALRAAQARGSASFEQQRAMNAYTGFGGMREMGQLPAVYPPTYVEASRAWEHAKRTGGAVRPEYASLMERVKDQYFTPMDICRATWALCLRTNPDAKVVLEPSAGIGRFLRTGPAGLLWHAIEYDPLMAQMMVYLYPEAHVYEGWFEAHQGQVGKVDLVVGNPPYGKRPPEVLRLDGPRISDAMDYFTTRGVSLLHPGGTLAYVVHLGFLTSSKRGAVRTKLLREAAFRGAAVLPSGAFPLVRDGSFAIMLWTKREKPIDESRFDEREQLVAQGQYLALPEAEAAVCGGEWRKASLGDGMYLHGAPDLSKIGGLWLAPAPAAPASTRVSVPVAPPPQPTGRQEQEGDQEAATTLAKQVQSWLSLLNRDPNEAERQRENLRVQVLTYLGEHGNPHPKGPAALRAVVSRDGTLESVLTQPTEGVASAGGAPDPREDFYQAVSWWSERRGYASAEDLEISEDEALAAALDHTDVMVELRAEGPLFYARWAYFTGSPAARITAIDSVLGPGQVSGELRAKLEAQKSLILQQWSGSKTITDIDVSVRAPFVPVECLQAWINHEIRPDWARNIEMPDIRLVVEDGLMSVSSADEGLTAIGYRTDQWNLDLLYWLLAYYNRATSVDRFDDSGTEKKVYHGLDARGIAQVDDVNGGKFLDWLGQQPQWVATIEAEYNTNFAPPLFSQIPTGPIDGLNTSLTLHPHQNQVVRKATLGGSAGSLLIAHDVGAGKTFSGIATAMRWRQTGAARRPLICVPASVLAKWYADATRLFPDARIGVIGLTPGRPGSDGPDVRIEKWLRFAAGAYDFAIVGHTAFFQDLEPDYDEVADVISGLLWARKQAGKQVASLRRIKTKLDAARTLYEQVEQASDWSEYRRLVGKFQGGMQEHRAKKLRELNVQIKKFEDQLAEKAGSLGTDTEMATVQQTLRDLLEKKPYRPTTRVAVEGGEELEEEETPTEDETESGEEDGKKKRKKGLVIAKEPVPGLLSWGLLGCDGLIVDEAHKFKNLWYPANQIEYAGKGQDELFGKKSPWDMLIKCMTIHRRHGGQGGVVFLTATPMTNSPLELYNLLCMVAPHVFEDAKMFDKEAFIDRYWTVEARDVVRPKGTMESAPALVGFKNGEEMLGLISSVFDKKSTQELVDAGWIKSIPTAEAKTASFERDAMQIALIRSLVAVFTAWSEKKDEDGNMRPEPGSVLANLDKHLWTVRGDKLVRLHEVPEESKPAPLRTFETAFRAKSILRLVWVSMLDKIAIDPRLLLKYAESVVERQTKHAELRQKFEAWEAAGGKGRPPRAPSWTEELTVSLAMSLFHQIMPAMEALEHYYASRPFVPKIQAVAEYIRDNKERPKGRCGHVLFLDWKELHGQLVDAIVKIAGIPRNRIALITGDTTKPQRLQISVDFNGRDEVTDRQGNILQSAVEAKYDVVIGTSQAMAEGIDLQRRSCAVHHLNLPWEPATLHQRNGRAVRQGNMMGSVDVVYYITTKTFDNVRYDKVARKAAWWEEMFRGQGATSNPAASEDVSTDLDEIILKMVIEDEEVLAQRIGEIRSTREARLRSQRIEKADIEWLALNAAFERARTAADQQRRDALFAVAVRRREAWKIANRDMVVPGAAELLNDEVVAVDWVTGRIVRAGSTFASTYDTTRVVKVRVQPRAFLVLLRDKGSLSSKFEPMKVVYSAEPAEPWTFAQEEPKLARALAERTDIFLAAASVSSDLVYNLTSIWTQAVQQVQARNWVRVNVTYTSPLFLQRDGRVFIAFHPADLETLGRANMSVDPRTFLAELQEGLTPDGVLAPTHPDAWATWVAAVREDRVWAPKAVSTSLGEAKQIRAERKVWSELSRAIFGKSIPAEAFAQRKALVGSDL